MDLVKIRLLIMCLVNGIILYSITMGKGLKGVV